MLEQEVEGTYTPQEFRGKPELQKRRIFESGIIGQRQSDPAVRSAEGLKVLRQKAAFVREANRRGLGTYRYPKLANLFGIADFDVAGKGPLRSAAAIEAEIVEPSQFMGQPEATRFPISTAQATGTLTVAPPTAPTPTPANLWEFYKQRGQALPSVQERSTIYETLGIGPSSDYLAAGVNNAAENQALLGALLREERRAFPQRRVERTAIPQTLRAPTGEEDIKITDSVTVEGPTERAAFTDTRSFQDLLERQSEQAFQDAERFQRERLDALQAGRAEEVARIETQLEVPATRSRLNDLRSLIASETQSYIENQANLRAETLPEGLSRGHMQKLQRDSLSKMQIFQAEAQALSGNLNDAEKAIDRALELKFLTPNQFLSTMNSTLRRMEDRADSREKGQIAIMKELLNRQAAEEKEKEDAADELKKLYLEYPNVINPQDITSDDVVIKLREAYQNIQPGLSAERARDIRAREADIARTQQLAGVGEAAPAADAGAPGTSYTDTQITRIGFNMLNSGVSIEEAFREVETDPRATDKERAKEIIRSTYGRQAIRPGAVVETLGFFENLFRAR
jgi:hypothetical protein